VLFIMFVLTLITTIVTLLWSVQFFTSIHSTSVLLWLNMIMIITWITLCVRFVHVHRCPQQKCDRHFKDSDTKYTELVHTEHKEEIESKKTPTL